jgi:hypothetical protein
MEEACNHDFLMKDDLGIVCRVCGLIQQHIDKFFEYSWKKVCKFCLDYVYRRLCWNPNSNYILCKLQKK